MDSLLLIPSLNPVTFFNPNVTSPAAYVNKQFDDYSFQDRGQYWQQYSNYSRVWQTTDIIVLQFESSFDPIIIELLDQNKQSIITLPALVGLPNKYIPTTHSFEIKMSLAGLQTGCYQLRATFGVGAGQLIMYTDYQYISSVPIPNTILINYYNTRFFKDIIFETGVQFQMRVQGFIDDDNSIRPLKQEVYRNQQYSNQVLSSKSTRNVPVHFGDFYGLPVDVTELLEQIFECNTVTLDGKLYGLADGSKAEYTGVENYRLRGLKLMLEPNLNRNSRAYSVTIDTTKQISTVIMVDTQAFGNTRQQGSDNTIPVNNQQNF